MTNSETNQIKKKTLFNINVIPCLRRTNLLPSKFQENKWFWNGRQKQVWDFILHKEKTRILISRDVIEFSGLNFIQGGMNEELITEWNGLFLWIFKISKSKKLEKIAYHNNENWKRSATVRLLLVDFTCGLSLWRGYQH